MPASGSPKPESLFQLCNETNPNTEEIARQLLDAPDINQLENGESLLHICARKGYFDLIKLLLMLRVKANRKNKKGKKPSQLARVWLDSLSEVEQKEDDEEVIKILEQAESNEAHEERELEEKINEFYTPSVQKMLRLVEELHEKKQEIKQKDALIKQLETVIEEYKAQFPAADKTADALSARPR